MHESCPRTKIVDAIVAAAGLCCFADDRICVSPEPRVWVDGRLRALTEKQHAVLRYLAERAGQDVPYTELFQVAWGHDWPHAPHTSLSDIIVNTRLALTAVGDPKRAVESVRGVGYRAVSSLL